ncbi:MAG: diguanylate cyclase, partial [Proteobacteria bacterium]|nr:diguanylate cyclase [Pseudomonadota bacterium]
MRETIIIAHPRFEEAQSIAARVTAASKELIILHADTCERVSRLSKEYNCSMVLIDSSLCLENLPDLLLPEEASLLLLALPEHTEQYLQQLAALPWIHDVITPSASSAELQRKIQLFLKLHRVSNELEECQNQITSLTERITEAEQSLRSHQYYLDILAEHDGLTGLYNRKHLTEVLQQEFARAQRTKTDL